MYTIVSKEIVLNSVFHDYLIIVKSIYYLSRIRCGVVCTCYYIISMLRVHVSSCTYVMLSCYSISNMCEYANISFQYLCEAVIQCDNVLMVEWWFNVYHLF